MLAACRNQPGWLPGQGRLHHGPPARCVLQPVCIAGSRPRDAGQPLKGLGQSHPQAQAGHRSATVRAVRAAGSSVTQVQALTAGACQGSNKMCVPPRLRHRPSTLLPWSSSQSRQGAAGSGPGGAGQGAGQAVLQQRPGHVQEPGHPHARGRQLLGPGRGLRDPGHAGPA